MMMAMTKLSWNLSKVQSQKNMHTSLHDFIIKPVPSFFSLDPAIM